MRGRQLHLLRPFTEWASGASVDDAVEWVGWMPEDTEFATWTSRCPARLEELDGGSVYFVRAGRTLFRMPFLRVEPAGRQFAILMATRLIRVEPKRVGFLRGWRYLDDADAPADLAPREDGGAEHLPPELQAALKEVGLV